MSQPPSSSPPANSCGIVGQFDSAESSWRMRGSGSTSTAANGTSSACSTATVRAEKPHAGASGVPFMNRITSCSAIACAIASRIGLLSPSAAGAGAGVWAGSAEDIGSGCGWLDMGRLLLSVGGDGRGRLRLERERVDRATDLRAEDRVHAAMLLDAAEALERGGRDRHAEVVAAAGVVLDLRVRARDRGLDALLYVLGGRHPHQD